MLKLITKGKGLIDLDSTAGTYSKNCGTDACKICGAFNLTSHWTSYTGWVMVDLP